MQWTSAWNTTCMRQHVQKGCSNRGSSLTVHPFTASQSGPAKPACDPPAFQSSFSKEKHTKSERCAWTSTGLTGTWLYLCPSVAFTAFKPPLFSFFTCYSDLQQCRIFQHLLSNGCTFWEINILKKVDTTCWASSQVALLSIKTSNSGKTAWLSPNVTKSNY